MTLSWGSGGTSSLAVTGSGVPAPAGGAEVQAVYALDTAAAGVTCVATGDVVCADEGFSGLYVKDYQAVTTVVPASASATFQRVSILNPPTPDSWPTEADMNPQRYVELAVSPSAGKALFVDGISLYAGADGGSTMGFQIQYSKHSDFSDATELLDSPSNPASAVNFYSFGPLVAVNPGETLRVRIYPYSKAVVKAKYLCLQAVTIHGIME